LEVFGVVLAVVRHDAEKTKVVERVIVVVMIDVGDLDLFYRGVVV
jgi:hypothetical protein